MCILGKLCMNLKLFRTDTNLSVDSILLFHELFDVPSQRILPPPANFAGYFRVTPRHPPQVQERVATFSVSIDCIWLSSVSHKCSYIRYSLFLGCPTELMFLSCKHHSFILFCCSEAFQGMPQFIHFPADRIFFF